MVEFLSSWVKNISLSLIIVSILEMILPNNKNKKYLKMIMGMFILFNIISPFLEKSNIFDLESVNFDDYTYGQTISTSIDQTSMDKRLKELYIEQLQDDITNKIEQKGYIVNKCTVNANISNNKDNSGIKKITLKFYKSDNEDKKETIEDKLVLEIKKIQKINIGKGNGESIKNITKNDIEIIKNFLIEEYGVSEECLEIN